MKNTKPTGRTLDMTKGSPMKLLFTFALPLFLGNLLQQFYNLADCKSCSGCDKQVDMPMDGEGDK